MTTRRGLSHAAYGKSDIRLVKVFRSTARHDLKDLRVDVQLEGDFEKGYFVGDNTDWMSTDTIRNRVYASAKDSLAESIERWGIELTSNLLSSAPLARKATLHIAEQVWRRIEVNGKLHDHSFVKEAGTRTATIARDGSKTAVEAGISGLGMLRTTGAGWEGYLIDEYTTLAETNDRIVATDLCANWSYRDDERLDFNALWASVRQQLLESFTDHYSRGIQNDIYLMGDAVLKRFPEVMWIQLTLPNKHHIEYDLKRFGIENNKEVFYAAGDPQGVIEGTVQREAQE